MESSSLTPLFEASEMRKAISAMDAATGRIRGNLDRPNHYRAYVPPFLAPASNGNREVARCARQIAAGKLRVTV